MDERLKEIRRIFNLTQQELADRLKIKRNTIAKYETGRGEPIDAVVSLICREFNISEKWLRYGDGDMFAPPPKNSLDALALERGMTRGDIILVEKFLNLSPSARKAVLDYALEVAEAFNKSAVEEITPSQAMTDVELREMFERQLAEEKTVLGAS